MATWHQNRGPANPLYHPEKWTVVVDPPHGCCTLSRFVAADEAEQHLARLDARAVEADGEFGRSHAYILPPAG